MNSNYVRGASLSCSSLQMDIKQMLDGAGAHDCRITSEHGNGAVTFGFGDHQFRLIVPHPEPTDPPRVPGTSQRGETSTVKSTRLTWKPRAIPGVSCLC
ncbi:hypothetical protein [Arthrobacter sp. QXT-31]|uniref:hypothetical protein n=1 Tax=Arthrobacter sp. QXT-31 TaxID=1357915 RepID=UPI0012F75EF1|nr:hypothetical protein [Arthrobacter sp. QXT-31]